MRVLEVWDGWERIMVDVIYFGASIVAHSDVEISCVYIVLVAPSLEDSGRPCKLGRHCGDQRRISNHRYMIKVTMFSKWHLAMSVIDVP